MKNLNCDAEVVREIVHEVVLNIAEGLAKPDPLYVKPGDTVVLKDESGKDFYLFMKEEGLTPFAKDRYCSEAGAIKVTVSATLKEKACYPYGLFMPGFEAFDPHFIVDPE